MTQYPADEDIWLILAEDIRQELGNKLSILGYYVGGDIVVEKNNTSLGSLALLFIARGGDGFVDWSVDVISPSGAKIPSPSGSVKLELTSPFVQAVKYLGVRLEIGEYKVILSFDGMKRYERKFVVKNPVSDPI